MRLLAGLPSSSLLRHREFVKLWAGQSVSLFGSQVTQLALPLTAATTLQASPAEMGLLAALQLAPNLLIGLFAGVWVDRLPRRPIMLWADLGRALLLGTIPLAALLGALRIEQLYVVGCLFGTLTVLFSVAYPSFVPGLVARDQLIEANSKLEFSNSAARLAGPGLAGALVQLVTAPIAILADAVSFLVSVLCLSLIQASEPGATAGRQRGDVLREIGEGLRVVLGNPTLRVLAGGNCLSNGCDSIIGAVFILYLTRELELEPATIGLIYAALGPGAILGAVIAGRASERFGIGPTLVGAACLLTAAVGQFAVVGSAAGAVVPLLAGAWFLIGVGNPLYTINTASLRQAITPPPLMGRVTATTRFFAMGAMPIGALIGGALGSMIGLRPTLVIGVLGYVVWALWLLLSPLRKQREQPAPLADPAPAR